MKVIFAVLAVDNATAVEAAIKAAFPSDHYPLGSGQWLLAASDTAGGVAEKLGMITPPLSGNNNNGLVLSVSGYSGRKSPQVWEWMKAKWGSE